MENLKIKIILFTIFMYNCLITVYSLGLHKINLITIIDVFSIIVSFYCYWSIVELDLKNNEDENNSN